MSLRLVMAFRWAGFIALSFALSSCSSVEPASSRGHFSGVWLYEFEGSTFVEGATGIPTERPSYEESDWLQYPINQPGLGDLREGSAYDTDLGCHPVQPLLITFVGQRSTNSLGSGHMGLWRSEVTVHRTISFTRLGPAFCYER